MRWGRVSIDWLNNLILYLSHYQKFTYNSCNDVIFPIFIITSSYYYSSNSSEFQLHIIVNLMRWGRVSIDWLNNLILYPSQFLKLTDNSCNDVIFPIFLITSSYYYSSNLPEFQHLIVNLRRWGRVSMDLLNKLILYPFQLSKLTYNSCNDVIFPKLLINCSW
jgi:hypothetical protein